MEGVEDGGSDFNELTLMRGFLLEQVDVVPVWGRSSSDLQKLAKKVKIWLVVSVADPDS
jgi:hypothetical protein